jgi:RNA polymerase sigma-70 factor (ECF subfamily)
LSSNRGRFRAFLLASLKHFLANEWDHSQRQKRGGGATLLSLDYQGADTRYQIDPPDHLSPDKLYDRAWAMTLLEKVITRLREETLADGRAGQFEQLKFYLMVGTNTIPYAEAAATLAMSEGTVRVAVHRLRRRYRELLQQEIVQTLADPAQADEEMRALMGAFSAG